MRFVSYNIHRGVGVDRNRSIERVTRAIARLEPDVVGLNEVVRVPFADDQPARIAAALGMAVAFQDNVRRRNVAYGNLLLVAGEIDSVRDIALPGEGEQRGLLVAEASVRGLELVFAVTHLSVDRETRRQQTAAISSALPRERPLVLAGDFNARPAELDALRAEHLDWLRLADPQATFPVPNPDAAIDHLLYSAHWRLTSIAARAEDASDHAALVVDLASVY